MDWLKAALAKVYADTKLVGVAVVVVLVCAVITWAVWMGLDVAALLRLFAGS